MLKDPHKVLRNAQAYLIFWVRIFSEFTQKGEYNPAAQSLKKQENFNL